MDFDASLGLLLAIPVGLAGLYYLAVPLLVKSQQRLAAEPEFVPFDFDDIDPKSADYLEYRVADLEALGFAEATRLELVDFVPNVTAYLVVLVDRARGDKAMAAVLAAGGPAPTRAMYVEFGTRFESGELFDTSNSPELNAFPAEGPQVRTQLPGVREVARLYELHRYVLDKHGVTGPKVSFKPGRTAEYLQDITFPELFERLTRWDWVSLHHGGYYHYTLTGAYAVTWGLLQPMKAMREARLRRAERALLSEFERDRGPDLGRDREI